MSLQKGGNIEFKLV